MIIFTEERSWWFTNDDLTFSSKEISQVSIGFDESVTKVKTVYSQEGPFDGLLGFSQGAAFAATLCALMNSDFRKCVIFTFLIMIRIIPYNCFCLKLELNNEKCYKLKYLL